MYAQLYDFLVSVFGEKYVLLAYSDVVTEPGLSVVYTQESADFDKELDGTTNNVTETYSIEIWHDTMLDVLQQVSTLVTAMEGTVFQVQSVRPVRVDGNKRKWHEEIQVVVMEELWQSFLQI